MGYKLLRVFINVTHKTLDRWEMFSADPNPKRGILARHRNRRRDIGKQRGRRCRRNCVMEAHRHRRTQRYRCDGGGVI
jgi:hypothetical protein